HFTRAEVRTMPGAFGDAFRAVEAMPGVVPTVSGLPFFFIRGAPPGNIGYFLDEVRVPMLYHLALGPSVIHPAMMNEVEFYPGSSPARFGRFAGGILNGVTKEPEPKFGGEYNLRLLDAGGYLQFPFGPSKEGETKKGTVTIGGRYGYPGLLLPIFAPDTTLAYWDYQIRAAWKFDEKHRIELFSFGAYDFLGQIQRDSEYDNSGRYVGETSKNVTLFDMTFHRYDLRYDYTPSPQRRLRIAGTFGYDFSGADVGRGVDRVVGLRAMYEDKSNPKLELRGGANVLWDRFTIEDREENVIQEDEFGLLSPRNALASGAFIEAKWKITPRFELYPGLRIDHFLEVREQDPSTVTNGGFGSFVNGLPKTASRLALDPRLTVRLKIRENLLYTSTLGMQHQPPALAIPVPGIGLSRLSDGLQESFLWSHGVEMDLPWSLTLTSSVFGAAFYGLTDASATCDFTDNNGGNNEVDCISERVKGRAYGLELMIRRPVTKRLSGFLSYTLSRSTRQAHALATYVPDGDEGLRVIRNPEALQDVPSEFDRTHVLHFALGYDLGNRWRIGGRMVYYSGRPFTQSVRFNGVRIPIPPANGLRAPGFFRLDARLEKTWQFSDNARLSFVLEVLNSTLSKETVNVECRSPNESVDGGPIRDGVSSNSSTPPNDLSGLSICDRFTTIGPVTIPSIGIEGTF
ncbi:MAG: TonB-dependent receptor, partial [Polyangiaceae bacterium]|nr:TonB-dependent receptor [Polyangiaceae bacterium]